MIRRTTSGLRTTALGGLGVFQNSQKPIVVGQSDYNSALNWTDNSTNEDGFIVEQATDANFTANLTSTTLPPNTITFTQTGLRRASTFFYRVRAFNLGGRSAPSNVVQILTP